MNSKLSARCIHLFLLLLLLCNFVTAQGNGTTFDINGHWEGAFNRVGYIQTVRFNIKQEGTGYKATYDNPDLFIFDEPVTEVSYNYPQLLVDIDYGKFILTVHPASQEMTGENKEWGPPVTLHLKRVLAHPRCYRMRDVVIHNRDVHIAGTLYLPLSPGTHPAVVMVMGSGDQGRTSQGYRAWGPFFAERGLVALLYDKRGVGGSNGDWKRSTFLDLAGDATAASDLLSKQLEVDSKRLGMMGISQGGWIAPLAASKTHSIKFLILDVAPAVTTEEQEIERVEYTMKRDGASPEDIREALDYTKQAFLCAYSGKGWPELKKRSEELKSRPWAATVGLVKNEAELETIRLQKFDPVPSLTEITIPVLALYGGIDTLVPPQENEAKMRQYLGRSSHDTEVSVIPDVKHDMETLQKLEGKKWEWPDKYWVWAKKSPLFFQTIVEWMVKRQYMEPARTGSQ
jgi:pimeloyl-ACP methyl ester carboxylesterase